MFPLRYVYVKLFLLFSLQSFFVFLDLFIYSLTFFFYKSSSLLFLPPFSSSLSFLHFPPSLSPFRWPLTRRDSALISVTLYRNRTFPSDPVFCLFLRVFFMFGIYFALDLIRAYISYLSYKSDNKENHTYITKAKEVSKVKKKKKKKGNDYTVSSIAQNTSTCDPYFHPPCLSLPHPPLSHPYGPHLSTPAAAGWPCWPSRNVPFVLFLPFLLSIFPLSPRPLSSLSLSISLLYSLLTFPSPSS